jgi:hypothetical protein
MPSCSVLGKIFYPIAVDNDYINDMLDIKLAIYTPFSIHMSPGIFLTSSDDIETFDFQEQIEMSKKFDSKQTDFVLVAHKSSIDVAKDHGCYGLGESIETSSNTPVYECEYVLQKPSLDLINKTTLIQIDEKTKEKFVYTDSVFYFTHSVIHSLLLYSRLYYESICDCNIEIDAYRDFLQPLGAKPCGLNEYLTSLKCLNPGLKRSIFENLYKIMLNKRSIIVALDNSIFYHLGTINELLDLYLLNDEQNHYFKNFRQSINFINIKNSFHSNDNSKINENLNCCLINSLVSSSNIELSQTCILEYCYFNMDNSNMKLRIENNCYLNNCYLNSNDLTEIDDKIIMEIPSNICLHTIPVRIDQKIKYITIFFSKNDSLKAVYSSFNRLKLLNRNILIDFKDDVDSTKFEEFFISISKQSDSNQYTFWNLRLFKVEDTMSKSFINAVKFINLYSKCKTHDEAFKFFEDILNNKLINNSIFLSLFDSLTYCDCENMILFRNKNFLSNIE